MPGTFSLMPGNLLLMKARLRPFSALPPWLPFGLSLFPSFFEAFLSLKAGGFVS